MEKRLERVQKETGDEGDSEEEEGAGGWEEGGTPLSRASFGAQDIGECAAIPEWEAPALKAEGGDRDFIPGLEVQIPSFE